MLAHVVGALVSWLLWSGRWLSEPMLTHEVLSGTLFVLREVQLVTWAAHHLSLRALSLQALLQGLAWLTSWELRLLGLLPVRLTRALRLLVLALPLVSLATVALMILQLPHLL